MAKRPNKSGIQKSFSKAKKSFSAEKKKFDKAVKVKTKSISDIMAGKVKDPSVKGMGIRSKIRTKVKDKGYSAILKELRKIEDEPFIKVGLPKESEKTNAKHVDEKGQAGKVTVLQVGAAHEFGTTKLPERSWLRAAHDSMRPEMETIIKKLVNAIYDGRITVSRALNIMGIKAVSETQKFLNDDKVKPPSKKKDPSLFSFNFVKNGNSKAPKMDKRTSMKTLIDTAQLRDSITFIKVMKKGKI